MKIWEIILKSLIIIILCFVVFYIDSLEFLDSIETKIAILIIAFSKSVYFVVQNYFKIKESIEKNVPYHRYLLFMAINIGLLIISFGVDFYSLYKVCPESFALSEMPDSSVYQLFEFLYYSTLNMTNFGFGTTIPVTTTAKAITSLEIILSFIAIIFVLSDFVSLRDSIRKP